MTTRLPELPLISMEDCLPYDLIGHIPGYPTEFVRQYAHAYGLAVWKAAIQQAAETVPTNWCDVLLTGKEGLGQPPYSCSDIERLLTSLRAAIASLTLPEQGAK